MKIEHIDELLDPLDEIENTLSLVRENIEEIDSQTLRIGLISVMNRTLYHLHDVLRHCAEVGRYVRGL